MPGRTNLRSNLCALWFRWNASRITLGGPSFWGNTVWVAPPRAPLRPGWDTAWVALPWPYWPRWHASRVRTVAVPWIIRRVRLITLANRWLTMRIGRPRVGPASTVVRRSGSAPWVWPPVVVRRVWPLPNIIRRVWYAPTTFRLVGKDRIWSQSSFSDCSSTMDLGN